MPRDVASGEAYRVDESKVMRRFEDRVRKADGCWEWTGGTDKAGYGRLYVSYRASPKYVSAHRYAYEKLKGEIPAGMCVLHSCDNRACVNPDHLFLGTQVDNIRDMDAKGRRTVLCGEASPNAKITESQVKDMRCEYERGARQVDLAERYGVSQTQVSDIVNRRSWAWV